MAICLIVWVMVTLCDRVPLVQCHANHDKSIAKYKMDASDMTIAAGDVMASYNVVSLSDCGISCTSNDKCYSFSYNDQSKMCDLTQQWYKEHAPNAMVVKAGTDVYSGEI